MTFLDLILRCKSVCRGSQPGEPLHCEKSLLITSKVNPPRRNSLNQLAHTPGELNPCRLSHDLAELWEASLITPPPLPFFFSSLRPHWQTSTANPNAKQTVQLPLEELQSYKNWSHTTQNNASSYSASLLIDLSLLLPIWQFSSEFSDFSHSCNLICPN